MRTNDPTTIPGWGADRYQQTRPGVPMEETPHPLPHAHWATPEPQEPTVEVLHHAGRDGLTPVFGTSTPPRGLSGALRRLAYKTPEYQVRHWQLMLLADRVDVLEGRIEDLGLALKRPRTWIAVGGVATLLGVLVGLRRKLL